MANLQLLRTEEIYYLCPTVLQEYGDVQIVSLEGESLWVNSLIFFSKSHYLRRLFQEESTEEVVLITEIPSKDLFPVLESLIHGKFTFPCVDIKGIVSCLEALGLQNSNFGPSFYYNNVTLEMDVDEENDPLGITSWDSQEPERPSCTVCGESFLDIQGLDDHIWVHFRKDRDLYCIPCDMDFNDFMTLKYHVLKFHESYIKFKPSSQCINCGQYNSLDPERFLDIHASSNPYHTPHCNYSECKEFFKSYSDHMNHVRAAHNGKFRIKCGRCDTKKSEEKAALIKKEKCVCELCGMSLSRGNMRTHLKVVHGNDPVDCDICKKTFNHPMSLKLHSDSAHREFPCEHCGFMCRIKALPVHICGKGFTTAYKFKQHDNIHRGIKPHTCKFCGKGFCNSSNRNQHEKSIHLGDKRVKPKNKTEFHENSTT
ncbi:KRAB [Lepeophtheirus salmonis]|uniref:KRAB n=1 Tax=Lepeophtheirus salmonis TaxID=72036 RepID=A0A7R8D3Z1_LEPSM|nr:KRAB [Lepeophtheirus salmonis]CAF3020881.1 KRAB [Lepeophtheirus salmonis]